MQEEVIEWGEVVEGRGNRHPGDMEKKASREDEEREDCASPMSSGQNGLSRG
jgi:hypothetical protein